MKAELIAISLPPRTWMLIVNLIHQYYPYIADEVIEDAEFLECCRQSGYAKTPERIVPDMLAEINFMCQRHIFEVSIFLIKQQWIIINLLLEQIYNELDLELAEASSASSAEEQKLAETLQQHLEQLDIFMAVVATISEPSNTVIIHE